MKRALFIGGTGTISMAITKLISTDENWELYLINRGTRSDELPANVKTIVADINDEAMVLDAIKDMHFDCVCDFIGFVPNQLERDYRLFNKRTEQYMYISSASAYQKPLEDYLINESTPLRNPYWEYSRNKIACEEFLYDKYRKDGYPITIIRPSHTYDLRSVPMGVHGDKGSYQVVKRMLEGKPVIVHGDGTSLWTLTFNEDFAKGFVGLMGNPRAIGEAFQITSDETLSWNQIYRGVARALGVEFRPYYVSSAFLDAVSNYDFKGGLIGDKANSVVFDNSKLRRVVPSFAPSVSFDEGVRRVVDYVMSHPECQIEDPEFDAWCDKVIETLDEAKTKMM